MIEDIREFLYPQLGYLAKSNGEQLWVHHYTVYKVCSRILQLVPKFPENLKMPLLLACLTHDLGKMRPEAQEILRGIKKSARIIHKPTFDELKKYIQNAPGLEQTPSEKEIKITYDIAVTHHSVSDKDIISNRTAYSSSGVLLLRISDWLASMESIDPITIERVNSLFQIPGSEKPLLHFTYFEIGREPGPSTSIIATKTLEALENLGYKRLIIFPNAAIMVKRGEPIYPEKEKIAELAYEDIRKNTLESMIPSYSTKNLLIGYCAEFPHAYLEMHKKQIIDDFSKADRNASAFFKLYAELMSLLGHGPGVKVNPWQLNVVHGLTTGVRGIPIAGREWAERTGHELPKQENGKLDRLKSLTVLFQNLTLSQLVPKDVVEALDFEDEDKRMIELVKDDKLDRLEAEKLFFILLPFAKKAEALNTSKNRKERLQEIAAMISFPVEADFAGIAAERLEAYKRYKKAPDPDKGVCEVCGSAYTQKPGTEVPDGTIQCFSYIKAHPKKPRAICYLCAYDVGLIRRGVLSGCHAITIWITSKVDFEIGSQLEDTIKRIDQSLINPRYLSRMVELGEQFKIPLPRNFKLPLTKNATDLEKSIKTDSRILQTPFGLFGYLRQVPSRTFSIKNYRAAYAPLFDVLQLLGFSVCITNDLEFRYGLFGEGRRSSIKSFYDSVSVLLLAKRMPVNKQNPYCMAADIISNQPSLAIARAIEDDNKGSASLTNEQLKMYIRSLAQANRQLLKGGELTMGELMNEAAFFARNIHHYCVEPEDRGEFWANLTKHKATKPVSMALNAMMRGRDFDEAMATFLAQLSVKIGKEEREGMDEFVGTSREILKRYYQLRQSSFSGFLKAKNALMNAIYAFTRYRDLDEVLVEDDE